MAVNTANTMEKLKSKADQQGAAGHLSPVSSKPKEEKKEQTITQLINAMQPEIAKALPAFVKPDRMVRLALTAIKSNPKLKECNQFSFIGAIMQAAQLGLEPNTPMGEAYIIPYRNNNGDYEAQFQIGYQGIISLAHRSRQFQTIYSHEVYENDQFDYKLGLHKGLNHIPADVPKGQPTYYYACYHLINGGYDFVVWSRAKMQHHAKKYSVGLQKDKYGKNPWIKNFDAMAKKTVIKELLKYAPKSAEFAQQLSIDETVKAGIQEEPEKVIIDMETEKLENQQQQENQWWNEQ